MQRAAQRLAYRDDQQHHAEQNADRQRVDRPDEHALDAESDVQQELYKYVQPAGEDERAAEDVQRTAGDVAHERDDRGDEQRNRPGDGEGEGQEPVPADSEVDVQQEQRYRGEIDRNEDRGVRVPEPQRQHNGDIQQGDAARGIARPHDGAVDAPVAHDAQHGGEQCQRRENEQHTGAVHVLRQHAVVGRKGSFALAARQVGVKHPRAA